MVFFFYEKIGCYRTIFPYGKIGFYRTIFSMKKLKSFFNFFLYDMFDLRLEKNAQPLSWRI